MSDNFVKVPDQTTMFAIFGFGVLFVTVILVLALVFPNPTGLQYLVMRIILALATASVATLLTGFISVEIPKIVKAGGAFAVFIIVFFYNPASLVATPSSAPLTGTITLGDQK